MHSSLADLHAYADGGLPPSQRSQLTAHLQACRSCQGRLEEVQLQREQVAQRLKAATPAPQSLPNRQAQLQKLHARRGSQRPAQLTPAHDGSTRHPIGVLWQRWSMWLAPLATAGLLFMWWSQPPSPASPLVTPGQSQPRRLQAPPSRPPMTPRSRAFPGLRAKGSEAMSLQLLYAAPKAASPQARLPVQAAQSGAMLRPGGLIQFRVQLGKPRHAMIVSVNAQGEIFAYAPFRGKASMPLPAGKSTRPLGSSLELDDVLGPERFVLLTSAKPFTYKQASDALLRWWRQHKDARRPLRLAAPWRHRSLLLYKQKPPTPSPRTTPPMRHRAP